MKRYKSSGAAAIVTALTAVGALGFVSAVPANASPNYFDNWPGNVVLDYQSPGGPLATNLQDLGPSPVPSLSAIFNVGLQGGASTICNYIEGKVEAQTSENSVQLQWGCKVARAGDLQATQLGTNTVGLRYLVEGNSFTFNYNGVPGGATINATYDLELDLTLDFAGQLGGSSGPTVTISSSSLGISNAKFTTKNVLVHLLGGDTLAQAGTAMDKVSVSPAANLLGLDQQVAAMNSGLLSAVGALAPDVAPDGSWCGVGGCPGAPRVIESQLFDLSATVDAADLNLVLSRGAVPVTAPVGCEFGSSSTTAPATLYAECTPGQPAGVTQLALLQDGGNGWTFIGPQAASALETPSLNGVPIGPWEPNAGPASAFAPWMQGPQVPGTGQTVQLTVCSFNQWGANCDPTTDFTLQRNSVSDPSTGGGGGIVGPPVIKGRCGSGGNCRFQ